jgi:hypothetical protein
MSAPYGWLNRWPEPMPQGDPLGRGKNQNTLLYACDCGWKDRLGEKALQHETETGHRTRLMYRQSSRRTA